MMTLTGNYVGPNRGAMTLQDIALGLSRMPRFGGQTSVEWHVTDHLVCATHYLQNLIVQGFNRATKLLPLHVLLHDAHEAMTGDIPTSFKTPDMRTLQARLDERIYLSLGIPMPTADERAIIKEIDARMLLAEARVVTPLATYEKICEEVRDTAWSGAVDVVKWHLGGERNARETFLALANQFTEEHAYVG